MRCHLAVTNKTKYQSKLLRLLSKGNRVNPVYSVVSSVAEDLAPAFFFASLGLMRSSI